MSVAGTAYIKSDPTLLADIRRYGNFDTAGCYQCGSCTISCELVTDPDSYPRKSIRYARLGLREPLLGNLEPWMCHDCGDCSTICPREAQPRVSMITLRHFLIGQYDWTGIAARLLTSRTWYFGSLGLVAALVLALLAGYHLWYVGLSFGDFARTPMGLEHMFPIMTYFTVTVLLLPLFLLLSHVFRIWRFTLGGTGQAPIPFSVYASEAGTYVYQSVTHSRMRKCPDKSRWRGHWILALGTTMMLFIKVFALRWFQTDNTYPLYNPQRWLGYLAAGFILYGVGGLLIGRVRAQKEIYKETRLEDLTFPILLLLTALSGLAVHIFRYAGFALACHFAYALHVVIATPMVLIEMSFGKWSHMIYRPAALYFQAVKNRAAAATRNEEVLPHAV